MGNIFLLAVASAFYPLLLAAVLVMLDTPRPKALLAGFMLLGDDGQRRPLGVAIVVALRPARARSAAQPAATVSPVIDIAPGALALFVALAMARGLDRPAPSPSAFKTRHVRRSLPGEADASAGARSASRSWWGWSSACRASCFVAALKDIAKSLALSATAFGLILAFNAIQFVLVELPLVGYLPLVAPERTRATVEDFNRWFRTTCARSARWWPP